jgi:phage FluMu gp28-like protein
VSLAYYAGQDLAKRRDYSALVILQVEEREDHARVARVVFVKQWPHVDYRVIIADTAQLYQHYQWEMLALDRGAVGEAVMEEYAAKGVPVDGVALTAPTKHDLVQLLLLLLQQQRLRLPRRGAEELKTQLAEQERLYSPAGTLTYRHPDNRHDDQFWALCLALAASREGGVVIPLS